MTDNIFRFNDQTLNLYLNKVNRWLFKPENFIKKDEKKFVLECFSRNFHPRKTAQQICDIRNKTR